MGVLNSRSGRTLLLNPGTSKQQELFSDSTRQARRQVGEPEATHKPEGCVRPVPGRSSGQVWPAGMPRGLEAPRKQLDSPTSPWVPEQPRTHTGAPREACPAGGVTHPAGASSGCSLRGQREARRGGAATPPTPNSRSEPGIPSPARCMTGAGARPGATRLARPPPQRCDPRERPLPATDQCLPPSDRPLRCSRRLLALTLPPRPPPPPLPPWRAAGAPFPPRPASACLQ